MFSHDLAYKQLENGESVLATVHFPPSRVPQPYTVAYHGGGFVIGSRAMIPEAQVRHLTEAGVVVVSADYRLCPQLSLYEGPIQDAKDAYLWSRNILPGILKEDFDIKADRSSMLAFGHSAGGLLALHLGTLPEPPRAITDFYGTKYTNDPFWVTPLPALAMLPDFDAAYLNKIFDEPIISNTMTSLEQTASARPTTKIVGMPKPDLSIVRNAWLFDGLKRGTHLRAIVQDGDYKRIDPVSMFSHSFPPTFFVHGESDDMVPTSFSEQAYAELLKLGVETGISLAEGKSHGFDAGMDSDDPAFKSVLAGLDFLIKRK
ncbi:hypothetical protein SLS60_004414 [Paraconiothyrium brasiliense]|uniref:Alpha/beta hydrolase fold-3 domain-containing protein n=1 Tax=Paraconiothyrium brasiliense TaxID=300254 RepID=A0ABR3RL68_9PLEO